MPRRGFRGAVLWSSASSVSGAFVSHLMSYHHHAADRRSKHLPASSLMVPLAAACTDAGLLAAATRLAGIAELRRDWARFTMAATSASKASTRRSAAARRRSERAARSSRSGSEAGGHEGRGSGARPQDGRSRSSRATPSASVTLGKPSCRVDRAADSRRCDDRSTITWRTPARRHPARRQARGRRCGSADRARARPAPPPRRPRPHHRHHRRAGSHRPCQREDLDEMLGNLLDKRLQVGDARGCALERRRRPLDLVYVDADGMGIDVEKRERGSNAVCARTKPRRVRLGLRSFAISRRFYGGTIELTDPRVAG